MWTLTALTATAFLLRLWWLPGGAEGWDAVDFMLALDDYDLERFQPHFPGYPVYVFAGRIVHTLGVPAEAACRSLNAICGAMLPLALHGTLVDSRGPDGDSAPFAGCRWSHLAVFLATLSPALLLGSVRIESDLPGLLLVVLAFRAGVAGRPGLAAFLAGLTLGVRLGAAPLVVGWGIWTLRRGTAGKAWLRPNAAGLLGGVAVWLVPLIAVVGPMLWREGLYFVNGHFRDWGGTAFVGGGWLQRWSSLGSTFGRVLAGTPRGTGILGALIVAGIGILLFRRRGGTREGVLPYWLVPQLITLVFFQNPEASRHYYPVILGLVAASFLGWSRSAGWLRFLGLVFMVAWSMHGLGLLAQRSLELPPSLRAVRAVVAESSMERDTWIFCGATKRLFDLEDPQRRLVVRRSRDFQGVVAELNAALAPPAAILVFSEVQSIPPDHESISFCGNPGLFDISSVDIYCYRVMEKTPGGELGVEAVDPFPGLLRRAER